VILGRRALLGLAGTAAALPLLRVAPAAALSAGRFAPPAEPMRYTRRLERTLVDGASLTVSRSFAVRFVPDAGGFRIDGQQVAVAVDAPAQIEALARLERERVETGVFPLQLDSAGAIRAVAPVTASAQLDAAVREVEARIERWQHTPTERAELRAFVEAVHQSAGRLVTELPRDLFAPVDCPREERRPLALPDGQAAQVRITFDATRDPATGLMREARREVVTEVSGNARRTLESWTLTPA
jgi:hypothetical protein